MTKYILLATVLVLAGCADSGTQGDSHMREYSDLVTVRDNSGTVTLNVYLHGASMTDTDTDQDTKNAATVSPETSASLAKAGATATAAVGEVIDAALDAVNTFTPDNSTNTETEDVTPTVNPDVPVLEAEEIKVMVYEMKAYENKSFAWLPEINYVDSSGPMTFTFDGGCGEFTVPDVKHIWGEDGNSGNYNQRFYFSGDPEEQADTHGSGKPTGSVFTAPGCAAKTVTVIRG